LVDVAQHGDVGAAGGDVLHVVVALAGDTDHGDAQPLAGRGLGGAGPEAGGGRDGGGGGRGRGEPAAGQGGGQGRGAGGGGGGGCGRNDSPVIPAGRRRAHTLHRPVGDGEAGDLAEVFHVAGDHGGVGLQGDGGDAEVLPAGL